MSSEKAGEEAMAEGEAPHRRRMSTSGLFAQRRHLEGSSVSVRKRTLKDSSTGASAESEFELKLANLRLLHENKELRERVAGEFLPACMPTVPRRRF